MESDFLVQVAFYVAAAFTLGTALIVVVERDLVRAVVALAMSFIGVAAIYFILNAEFIGVVQILVYVGAISILIAFSVMFIGDLANAGTLSQNRVFAFGAGVLVLAAVIFVAYNTDWTGIDEITNSDAISGLTGEYQRSTDANGDVVIAATVTESDEAEGGVFVDSSSHIGALIIREFILPFETLGLLLIAALIGALMVIRNRREDGAA